MFKIAGGAAVILASGIIGIKKYMELSERKRILYSVYDGAESILNNLRCMCMPLYDCFLSGGEFFMRAAEYMADGALPKDAVKQVTNDTVSLTSEDKEIFSRFSDGLSREDCEGQIRNAEIFLSELGKSIENAKKQLDTKGRLFVRGSLLIGVAVVLVLM